MKRLILLIGVSFCSLAIAVAQGHHTAEEDTVIIEARTIKDFFHSGVFGGHVRYYGMATMHESEAIQSRYANAIGARIDYRSAYFHGFQFGLTGLFTFDLLSSRLDNPEFARGLYPKFELQLFDINDPHNTYDMDRLDELYIHYHRSHTDLKAGRMAVESPLINTTDTRMKPYAFQGIWLDMREIPKTTLRLGWLDHMSPRSTVHWYKAGESIGIYGMGRNADGSPSQYADQVQTKGVGVMGLEGKWLPNVHFQAWDYLIENVSNTVMLQAERKPQGKHAIGLTAGLQFVHQEQVGNGGNPLAKFKYFADDNLVRIWGGSIGYQWNHQHFSFNYLQSGDEGRFTFPNEWGRENFFVTTARGRTEGLGNAKYVMFKYIVDPLPVLHAELHAGTLLAPDEKEFQWNKYGNVSHDHVVLDVNYHPAKQWEGLSVRLLYVYKHAHDRQLEPGSLFYNADFHHFNLITNIVF